MLNYNCFIVLYNYIHTRTNLSGNIVNNNDNFNERTNTLLYKNTPLTLYSRKGWRWWCLRGELETGTDYYILNQSSSDRSITSFASELGGSTVGHWGPQTLSLQADSHTGILSPTDSNCNWRWTRTDCCKPFVVPGYIIVWRPPASCGRTHLHRIQPRPQVKLIFRYL